LLSRPKPELGAITFDYLSEACCAIVLEKCVPDWKCIPGETFQYPLAFGRFADFVVKHKVIEYHPIIFKHEMNEPEHKIYKRLWYSSNMTQREDLDQMLHGQLLTQYFKRRKTLIQHDKKLESKWLDVCVSPTDFCNIVAEISPYKADRINACWESTWNFIKKAA
jgi:hypothetical protein